MKSTEALWLWNTPDSLHAAHALPHVLCPVTPSNWTPIRKIHRLCAYAYCSLLMGDKFQGIGYEPAPYLIGSQGNISFSHTANWQALLYHPSEQVGVDIERLQARILPLTAKFLVPSEREFATDILQATLAFSAKEALFKAKGLPFRDLIIHSINHTDQQITVYCPQFDRTFKLYFLQLASLVLVYWVATEHRLALRLI